jgi:flagellar hook-associated protein 1 FlgK
LNQQIASGTAAGTDVTALEDKRDSDLQDLSSNIGISYFTDASNRVAVYTSSGQNLVGFGSAQLSYTASGQLDNSAQYPGSISGIMLNGTDITPSITSGTLGGLISLRDKTLVSEQAKLDQLAQSTIGTLNAVTNEGSAVPAPTSLTSGLTVASTDAFSASGSVRIAVVSASGAVQSYQDLDLSSFATIGDVVGALNSLSGVQASINTDGKLTLSSTDPADGIAINNLSSAAGSASDSFSQYFGFNDLFQGTDAATIAVAPALKANPSLLPTALLSASASLAPGDTGLGAGDSTVSSDLLSAFTNTISLPASSGFSAKTNNLSGYASDFVSSAATLISNADSRASTSKDTLSFVQNSLQNQTGINTDEELALITQYQNQYQANAQLITIARALFQDLITMVS